MITIIDYGLGNIQAFVNVFKQLHIPVVVAQNADELLHASKIILPGVGAFDHAMKKLNDSGMRQVLDELVLNKKIPVLGICVGMQMLADSSDEGKLLGLGWIKGHVRNLNSKTGVVDLPLPHMGWNDVSPTSNIHLLCDFKVDTRFYFLHSYFFECQNSEDSIATSSYGIEFTCAIAKDNILGVQFHPEKSHHFGVNLLRNFAEL